MFNVGGVSCFVGAQAADFGNISLFLFFFFLIFLNIFLIIERSKRQEARAAERHETRETIIIFSPHVIRC